MEYDVIVIGLGGMGSATAYQLARRGQRVLGLERHTPGHNLGSSHGYSRIIRQAYFEHPAYVPLLQRAYTLWEQIAQESGREVMTLTGGLMIGQPESEVMHGSILSAQLHHLPHEVLDAATLRQRFPQFRTDEQTIALYEERGGFVRPEESVLAHLGEAAKHSAELRFEEPVTAWHASPNGTGVTVQTAKATYHADRLVIAPGAWASGLLQYELPLDVGRAILFWFEPVRERAQFLPERFPIYIWEIVPQMTIYGFPAQDGPPGGVKVAFFRMPGNPDRSCTPTTIDRTVHPHEVELMRESIAERLPNLNGRLLHTATCMYTNTPDQHFVIGLHPHYEQVVIASPCSGHGYKFASVIGEILADLAIAGQTQHPIDLFHPGRWMAGTQG